MGSALRRGGRAPVRRRILSVNVVQVLAGYIRQLQRNYPNFRRVLYLYAIVFVLSSVTLPIGLANLGGLRASLSTPWGVVTGIFVHTDFNHYVGNMTFLFALIAVFLLMNLPFDGSEQRRRATLFAWTAFLAAVIANALWIWRFPSAPEGAYGASGVVYAAVMVVTMFSLFNIRHHAIIIWRVRETNGQTTLVHLGMVAANLVVLLPFLYLIVTAPAVFLGVGTGVNVLGHGVAAVLALPACVGYESWRLRSRPT